MPQKSGKDLNMNQEMWREEKLSLFRKNFPFFEKMYSGLALNSMRIEEIRKRLNTSGSEDVNSKLLAFFLGTIEGDFCSILDPKTTPRSEIMTLVGKLYSYFLIKDLVIKNDSEYTHYMGKANEAVAPENEWFRKCGVLAGGFELEDKNVYWESLEEKIKSLL